jgi:diaminohydroxyphosphoribosylaminopyrimidine deaminase/5-amino-6-(5-phosphoribosylamino)uracil reductase
MSLHVTRPARIGQLHILTRITRFTRRIRTMWRLLDNRVSLGQSWYRFLHEAVAEVDGVAPGIAIHSTLCRRQAGYPGGQTGCASSRKEAYARDAHIFPTLRPRRMSRTNAAEVSLAAIRASDTDQPYVIAQLGQSLDGRIATVSGDSRWINGANALDHLHALRAAVDAVVVGVGTVVADDPQLTVRRVVGVHPARVVIDPTGRAPGSARCFVPDGTACFSIMACEAARPAGVRPIVLRRTGGSICPAEIVRRLFALGMRRILIEGGSDTISRFIDAGVVDRLHVLLAPIILGSGRAGLELAPIMTVAQAMRPTARVHVFPDGDVLFDCDLRPRRADAA